MCSAPATLQSDGLIDLSVKFSTWPPAHWIHTQCQEGDEIRFRFGGDFFYDETQHPADHSLLLVAGGVGINPLYSIIKHVQHLDHINSGQGPSQVSLLYSAASSDELIFRDDIDKIKTISSQYFVTRQAGLEDDDTNNRRINKDDIEKCLSMSDSARTVCYLCGPPQMVDTVREWLRDIGISNSMIKYENWW